jgi:hypothetical protein
MPYTIIESQLPLIGGLAGHNLIVVKGDCSAAGRLHWRPLKHA